ncbi:MAG: ABC transporter permease [Gemmatimonadota bacterium]
MAIAVATIVLVLLLLLPLVGILLRVDPAQVFQRLGEKPVLDALWLSVKTSTIVTVVVVCLGLPAAYLLATREFAGKRCLETLVDLPMILPPTVSGFALLMAFGRAGIAGKTLSLFGLSLPFTTLGVVVAQVFMAVPFFIGPARAGFASVEQRYLDAAATLRASPSHIFWRVMIPLSRGSLLAGAAMAWARALGEFGATITFAGNLPGRTQTMPLAVYLAMQDDLDRAATLSILLVTMAVILLLGLRRTGLGLFAPRRDATRQPA